MLVLTRKDHQVIDVWHGGELLRLIVVESRPGTVRIAFDGPHSFVVLREGLVKHGVEAGRDENRDQGSDVAAL